MKREKKFLDFSRFFFLFPSTNGTFNSGNISTETMAIFFIKNFKLLMALLFRIV